MLKLFEYSGWIARKAWFYTVLTLVEKEHSILWQVYLAVGPLDNLKNASIKPFY